MKRLTMLIVAAACAATLAQPASAAAPPGKYFCYRYGATILYQGWVTLTSATTYTAYTGAKGTYRSAGATLTMKTGPYKGWIGKYKHDTIRKSHIIDFNQGVHYRATCSKKA